MPIKNITQVEYFNFEFNVKGVSGWLPSYHDARPLSNANELVERLNADEHGCGTVYRVALKDDK